MKRILLIFTALALVICAGCSKPAEDPTQPSETLAPQASETVYTVTVVDDFGAPVTEGIIVNFHSAGEIAAMQAISGDGTASKTLNSGVYTVSLSFTAADASYHYSENITLTPDAPTATVYLTGYRTGRELYAGGKDHFAYLLDCGTTAVPVTVGERTYFLFAPSETGMFEFSVSDNALIGYYGSPFFVQDNCLEEIVDGKFTVSVSSGMLGSVLVLGVDSGKEQVNVTITRIGDAQITIEDYEWTVYQPVVTPKPFVLPENVTLVDFDLTADSDDYKLVYNEKDGFYHLGSADGEVVYFKLGVGSVYLDPMTEILDVSGVSRYFFDEDGNFLKKETYNECLMQYVACMDEESGLYPLTQDLYYIIHQRGEYVGWWDKNSPTFLFVDDNDNPVIGLNQEIAWLFICCYGQEEAEETPVQPTEPAPTDPAPTEPAPTEPEPTEPEFQMGKPAASDAMELFYYQIEENMSFEATVKSGEYVAYDLYRMFDMVLTIESDYAYIVFDNQVYLPENGILTYELQYTSNDVSSPCSLYIGNFGNSDATFTVKLSTLPGTQNNPSQLPLGTFTTTTREGDYQGYYYLFTAESDGVLTLTLESINIDEECQITLYNWYSYEYKVAENGVVSIPVLAGDEVEVNIAVLDDAYAYPAAVIVTTATFE